VQWLGAQLAPAKLFVLPVCLIVTTSVPDLAFSVVAPLLGVVNARVEVSAHYVQTVVPYFQEEPAKFVPTFFNIAAPVPLAQFVRAAIVSTPS
jgi:hypothetical protein